MAKAHRATCSIGAATAYVTFLLYPVKFKSTSLCIIMLLGKTIRNICPASRAYVETELQRGTSRLSLSKLNDCRLYNCMIVACGSYFLQSNSTLISNLSIRKVPDVLSALIGLWHVCNRCFLDSKIVIHLCRSVLALRCVSMQLQGGDKGL